MDAVVAATGLEKRYGETVALHGASLSVERGAVYALIGPNGAGKTTLVRALTGTTDPDAGTATVLGASPASVDRDRLGVLPQDFAPPDRLTAREVLAYYAGLYANAKAPDTVLESVGLTDAADTWYEHLSGGQQRRVCVGATLVNEPDVLFLDEPTTGIDPAGRRTVWRLIEELAAAGTTVVLTTHDMAEAERLADRVGVLARGEIVAEGPPAALIDRHAGESRLALETTADPAAFDDLEYPVTSQDGQLFVGDVDPAEIGSIVDYLLAEEIPYSGLAWTEPTLEDVYLELAGDLEATTAGGTDPTTVGGTDQITAGDRP